MPVIGFLASARRPSVEPMRRRVSRRACSELGYVEGQNVAIEYRWAEGRCRALADAGGRTGSPAGGRDRRVAARQRRLRRKAATATIPIVFAAVGDPVGSWACREPRAAGRQRHRRELFQSRAGGKAAGAAAASWCPSQRAVGRAVEPDNADAERQSSDGRRRLRALSGMQVQRRRTPATQSEIDAAFATLGASGADALLSSADPFCQPARRTSSAWRHATRCPRSMRIARFVEAGGLMSYGARLSRCCIAAPASTSTDSQGREAGRPAGRAADQVRAGHQPQDREGARPRRAADRCSPAPTR